MLTMKALVTTEGRSATVQDIEIPKPGEGEILVKVHYCAQNPADWKAVTIVPPGRIIGCDFAGTVVNSNGSSWREGHRVAGFVHGTADHPTRGVFAEYAIIEKSLVYRIPDDITFQQVAVIPVAFATAVQAMFQRLKMPEPPQVAKGRRPFLVNGGASSVGQRTTSFSSHWEIENEKIRLESTIVATVFERPVKYGVFDNCGNPTPEDRAMWENYLVLLPELLSSGKIKSNRIHEMGGINDIMSGFELHQEGKVSAEKLVYKIA
ncbi:chaperonin 10-like protein [Leptodontidium sp. 2 PMI_412]|nr:chaperonin 10-like protein [Leptodontidium sp. 2 PMI_412]